MQVLVVSQRPNNVPAQAVDIDPATCHPVFLGVGEELVQRVVVELMALDSLVGKVDNGDLTACVEMVVARDIGIFFGVDSWLRSGLLVLVGRRRLVVPHRMRARYASAQGRVYGGAVR